MSKSGHRHHGLSEGNLTHTGGSDVDWNKIQLDFGQVAFFSEKGFGFLSSLYHSSRDYRKAGSVFFHISQVRAHQARQTLEASRGNNNVDLYFWFTASYVGQRGFQADELWLTLQDLPEKALSAVVDQLITTVGRTTPTSQMTKMLCAQLFGDNRISDDRLKTLFASGYFRDDPEAVVTFLRATQFDSYAQHLDLPAMWRDISSIPPEWAETITERLLGAEQLRLLREDRRVLQDKAHEKKRIAEERRRREQEERLRTQQAAETQRREEESRLAQARAEQEAKDRAEVAKRQPRSGGRRADGQKPLKPDWHEFAAILEQFNISRLYHFTDRSNLESIQQHGGLYSWHYLKSHGIRIPRAGGDDESRHLDMLRDLEDYVRLSFNHNQPMLYIARQDGRIVDPVILQIDPQVIFWKDTLFSNINAAKRTLTPTIGPDLEHFQRIPLAVATSASWAGELQRNWYQAEVMVKTHVPLAYILNFNQIYQPVVQVAARWW